MEVVVVDTERELLELTGKKPKHVYWDDTLRGGSFTLNDNPQPDDGGIWFNGYKREFSGAVYPEWFGAKGDGVTDDTVAIQSAIDSTYKIRLEKLKTYLLSGSLTLKDGTYIDLNGGTITSTFPVVAYGAGSFTFINGTLITTSTTHYNTYDGVLTSLNKSAKNIILDKVKISSPNIELNGCSIIASNSNAQVENVYLDVEFIDVGRMGIEFVGHGTTDADRLVNFIDNIHINKLVTKNTGLNSVYGMGVSFSGEIRNVHVKFADISNYKDIGFEIATGGKSYGGGTFFIDNLILNNTVPTDYGIQCSVAVGDTGAKSVKFNNISSTGTCRFRFDVYGKCVVDTFTADSVYTLTGEHISIRELNISDIQYYISPRSVAGAKLSIDSGNISSTRSGNAILVTSSNNIHVNNVNFVSTSGYITKSAGTGGIRLNNCIVSGGTNYAIDTSKIVYIESSIDTTSTVDTGTNPLVLHNVYVNGTLTNQ